MPVYTEALSEPEAERLREALKTFTEAQAVKTFGVTFPTLTKASVPLAVHRLTAHMLRAALAEQES